MSYVPTQLLQPPRPDSPLETTQGSPSKYSISEHIYHELMLWYLNNLSNMNTCQSKFQVRVFFLLLYIVKEKWENYTFVSCVRNWLYFVYIMMNGNYFVNLCTDNIGFSPCKACIFLF
jgi:hypothetical protein